MSAILKLSGVSKRFGALLAIDNLSMHLNAGEALGVIGPNGSCRTVLNRRLRSQAIHDLNAVNYCT